MKNIRKTKLQYFYMYNKLLQAISCNFLFIYNCIYIIESSTDSRFLLIFIDICVSLYRVYEINDQINTFFNYNTKLHRDFVNSQIHHKYTIFANYILYNFFFSLYSAFC